LALDLLQDTPPRHVGVAIASEHKHRNAIHITGGYAGHGVHRAGANGGKDSKRHARDAVVGVGQVHRRLFVAHLEQT